MSLPDLVSILKKNPEAFLCDTACCACHAPMICSMIWPETYPPRYFCKVCAPLYEWRGDSFWKKDVKLS